MANYRLSLQPSFILEYLEGMYEVKGVGRSKGSNHSSAKWLTMMRNIRVTLDFSFQQISTR